jgi:hypothetical protein
MGRDNGEVDGWACAYCNRLHHDNAWGDGFEWGGGNREPHFCDETCGAGYLLEHSEHIPDITDMEYAWGGCCDVQQWRSRWLSRLPTLLRCHSPIQVARC